MNSFKDINVVNIYLMLGSLLLACALPFEVFLLSYAILGPLHYLTEISWLKDKGFFLPHKHDIKIISVFLILMLLGSSTLFNIKELEIFQKYYGFSIFYCFAISAIMVLVKDWSKRFYYLLAVSIGLLILLLPIGTLIFLVYLPTLIHVYIFTGLFILFGALKTKSKLGYLSIFVFLMCPVVCFLIPSEYYVGASVWAQHSYNGTFSNLSQVTLESIFGLSQNDSQNIYTHPLAIQLGRFIAFAYTYHYLNWFSKTNVIKWNNISKKRYIVIIAIWLLCIAIYLYDYALGFKTLFVLSFIHVVLEFPLNNISIVGITNIIISQFKKIQ